MKTENREEGNFAISGKGSLVGGNIVCIFSLCGMCIHVKAKRREREAQNAESWELFNFIYQNSLHQMNHEPRGHKYCAVLIANCLKEASYCRKGCRRVSINERPIV